MSQKIALQVEYEDESLTPQKIVNALRSVVPATVRITATTNKRVVGAGYHRPVCPKCHVELRPERNGIGILDMADFGPHALWDSDLWKCPECGIEVVGGFGEGPISAHYQDDFSRMMEMYKSKGLLIENRG